MKMEAHSAPVINPTHPASRLTAKKVPPAHELKPDHTARKTTIRRATRKKLPRIRSRLRNNAAQPRRPSKISTYCEKYSHT